MYKRIEKYFQEKCKKLRELGGNGEFFPRDCGNKKIIPARRKNNIGKKDVLLNNGCKCAGNGEEVGKGEGGYREVKQPPTWGNIVLPNKT